jgi:hypothetical protein
MPSLSPGYDIPRSRELAALNPFGVVPSALFLAAVTISRFEKGMRLLLDAAASGVGAKQRSLPLMTVGVQAAAPLPGAGTSSQPT